jgi:hypothetical protein
MKILDLSFGCLWSIPLLIFMKMLGPLLRSLWTFPLLNLDFKKSIGLDLSFDCLWSIPLLIFMKMLGPLQFWCYQFKDLRLSSSRSLCIARYGPVSVASLKRQVRFGEDCS